MDQNHYHAKKMSKCPTDSEAKQLPCPAATTRQVSRHAGQGSHTPSDHVPHPPLTLCFPPLPTLVCRKHWTPTTKKMGGKKANLPCAQKYTSKEILVMAVTGFQRKGPWSQSLLQITVWQPKAGG